MQTKIPFSNLKRQITRLRPEIEAAIGEVIDSQAFIAGKYEAEFSKNFAMALGSPFAVGCSNGTSALSLALEACGVKPGDEVITVANTFFATVEAIYHVGGVPVLVDVCANDYTIDPALLEASITPKTKAIIPVHLYGTPCRMDAILDIAKKHQLVIVEDCAQAHLATYNGKCIGTFGDAGAFSFYPGKNLGAFGDAGAITTQDEKIATILRKLSNHGRMTKYEHDMVGYNHRMDGMQAAILNVKLPYLQDWSDHRLACAKQYDARLKSAGFKVIEPSSACKPAYHLYVVEVSNRDEVQDKLQKKGISTGIHYPVPLHQQPALSSFKLSTSSLDVTESAAARIVSLPICGEIHAEEVDYVINAFLECAKP